MQRVTGEWAGIRIPGYLVLFPSSLHTPVQFRKFFEKEQDYYEVIPMETFGVLYPLHWTGLKLFLALSKLQTYIYFVLTVFTTSTLYTMYIVH